MIPRERDEGFDDAFDRTVVGGERPYPELSGPLSRCGQKRRLAAYLRVSTDDQRERETSNTQRDEIIRYVERTGGCEIVEWFVDDGVSGTIPLGQRLAGRRLLENAAAGKFDGIIVTRADRLGRDVIDLMQLRALFEQLGIELVGAVEPLDDELGFDMRAVWAKHERRRFLARSREGLLRAAREGRFVGGICPYGYKVEGKKQTARLAPDEAVVFEDMSAAIIVHWIFELSGREGWSCYRIADHLNALGVPTCYAKDRRLVGNEAKGRRKRATAAVWRPSRIRAMLIAPIYRGEYGYGKRNWKKPGSGPAMRREVIVSECPRLVSDELWAAAQATLKDNRIGRSNRTYPLTGLIKCGLCGLSCVACWNAKAGKAWYRCGGKLSYRGKLLGRCPARDLDGGFIESLVFEDVGAFLLDPGDVLGELAAEPQDCRTSTGGQTERVLLQQRLADVERRRKRLVDALGRELITEGEFREQASDMEAERISVERCLADLGQPEPQEAFVPEDMLMELRRRVEAGLTPAQQFDVVGKLVAGISVHTSIDEAGKKALRVEVRYRFPAPQTPESIVARTRTDTRADQNYGGLATRVVVLP